MAVNLPPIPQDAISETFKWRDWFRTLRSFVQSPTSVDITGGSISGTDVKLTYGAFQNTNNITLAAADTPTLIPVSSTDYSNNTYFVVNDGVHVNTSGIYNYQFSLQFANPDTTIHQAVVWLRKNGQDIQGTGSKFDVSAKHGSLDGYLIATCNFYVDLNAGDYVELWWAADSTQLYIEAYPAQTTPYPRPSIPSAVATLTYVSSL